jgi:hypothetical protein
VVGGERFGRYSFIGLPARTWLRASGFGTEVVSAGEVVETHAGNPLDFIAEYPIALVLACLFRLPFGTAPATGGPKWLYTGRGLDLALPAGLAAFVVAIDRLLQDIAAGAERADVTPGLKAFISQPLRESAGRRLKGAQGWTFVGCDPVEGRGISRLGTQVVQVCYARGLGAAPNSLVTVLYGTDWRAAGFDFYSY